MIDRKLLNHEKKTYWDLLEYMKSIQEEWKDETKKIFDYLKSQNKNEELMELFSIYAISSEWLRP